MRLAVITANDRGFLDAVRGSAQTADFRKCGHLTCLATYSTRHNVPIASSLYSNFGFSLDDVSSSHLTSYEKRISLDARATVGRADAATIVHSARDAPRYDRDALNRLVVSAIARGTAAAGPKLSTRLRRLSMGHGLIVQEAIVN